jgi:hypothetical protein
MSTREARYLGDGVYVRESDGMIYLKGNAYGRDNVIFLERAVYQALREWARNNGFEPTGGKHE